LMVENANALFHIMLMPTRWLHNNAWRCVNSIYDEPFISTSSLQHQVSVEKSQAYNDIKDLVVHKGKDRHSNKQLKAFNKETNKISSNKKQQNIANSDGETRRRCRLCYKSGHYAPKCPNKENVM
ncbi:3757_t:CDS:2, partial [Cetraspora pellucida]